jgi:hypothetical protein
MKSKYPKKIKLGPYTYEVKTFPEVTEETDHGACVYSQQVIFLSKNQHAERAGDTLLHEVLHAIWDLAGLDVVPDLHEEVVVRSFATWLSAVLKDNPSLASFILNPNESWIPEYSEDALTTASKRENHE